MTLPDGQSGFGFRTSIMTFLFLTLAVTVSAVGLLILLDPRAQAFWGTRLGELGTFVRALVSR